MKKYMKTKKPLVVLMVKPVTKIPAWWPRDEKGELRWVTVNPDLTLEKSWAVDFDVSKAFPAEDLKEVKQEWRSENDRRQWKYMVFDQMGALWKKGA